MEQLYYILDTELNEVVIDNISYDDGINWLIENGVASKHIILPKEN